VRKGGRINLKVEKKKSLDSGVHDVGEEITRVDRKRECDRDSLFKVLRVAKKTLNGRERKEGLEKVRALRLRFLGVS